MKNIKSNKTKNKILLFIDKNANYFQTNLDNFRDIVLALGKIKPFAIEVVDIEEKPELASKYKIKALPTLIIGKMRYIGEPTAEKAIEIFRRKILE